MRVVVVLKLGGYLTVAPNLFVPILPLTVGPWLSGLRAICGVLGLKWNDRPSNVGFGVVRGPRERHAARRGCFPA